jgi:hypothetical protein
LSKVNNHDPSLFACVTCAYSDSTFINTIMF